MKLLRMRRTSIIVRPEAYWFLCACLLLLPLKLVLAWLISVAVHEGFHYGALKLCGCRVPCVRIGAFGAQMETGPLTSGQEIVCAAAGPVGGLLLLLFLKKVPLIAVVGLLHTAFNLIPLFPLDGGRVLHAIIRRLTKGECIISVLDMMVIAALLGFAIYGLIKLFLGPLPLLVVIALIYKNKKSKSSCKLGLD